MRYIITGEKVKDVEFEDPTEFLMELLKAIDNTKRSGGTVFVTGVFTDQGKFKSDEVN